MIYAVVVVYNKFCDDSDTCKALLSQDSDHFKVLIWDNSEKDLGNKRYCEDHGWQYATVGENAGLSKAYNKSIDLLKRSAPAGSYVCLMDDDTHFPVDYISRMQARIDTYSREAIYLPILVQNDRILSPWKDHTGKKDRYFDSVDSCLTADPSCILAFNAGMTIPISVFDTYHYDERIFLDGVDYMFLRTMKERGCRIIITDITCRHGYSGGQKSSYLSAMKRFRIYAKDMAIVYENERNNYRKLVGRRALHLCLMYRRTAFLTVLWEIMKNNR